MKLDRWHALGVYLGYPICCVFSFCDTLSEDTRDKYPNGPWVGTGFIPCVNCAPHALDFERFVKDKIEPQRLSSVPFPGHNDIENEELVPHINTIRERLNEYCLSSGMD